MCLAFDALHVTCLRTVLSMIFHAGDQRERGSGAEAASLRAARRRGSQPLGRRRRRRRRRRLRAASANQTTSTVRRAARLAAGAPPDSLTLSGACIVHFILVCYKRISL